MNSAVRGSTRRTGPRHYAEDLGWKHRHTPDGTVYTGFFRAYRLSFHGWIRRDPDGKLHFLVHRPPMQLLKDTAFFGCFHARSDGWQLVAFKPDAQPSDVHSGIAAIQKALMNAFEARASKRKVESR